MKKIISLLLLTFLFSCSTENWESVRTKTDEALREKNYSKAIEYLEEVLSREPQNAEAHYYLGQTYRMMIFSDGGMLQKINMPYAEKSSEQFRKTIEISPEYEGRTLVEPMVIGGMYVGDPHTKILSIWASVAMNYLYNNKPDSAKWAFKHGQSEGAFYPAIMEYNKNIMASCEKNAILFTDGSNDTFPMWFLQLVENYRTDITVVNLSFIRVLWYIKQLKNEYPFGENNLFITLTDTEIDSLRSKYWTVEIPVKHNPLNKEGKIEWMISSNKRVYPQDLMLMEILKSNDWNRPIYFSTTIYGVNRNSKYLTIEGLVYKLNSYEAKTSAEKLYSNLTQVYTYDGLNDMHIGYINDMASLLQNYRNAFHTLASEYDKAGNEEKAGQVLEIMDEKIPETQLP
jgi:tetratricopeptide (TPR) repeat protein